MYYISVVSFLCIQYTLVLPPKPPSFQSLPGPCASRRCAAKKDPTKICHSREGTKIMKTSVEIQSSPKRERWGFSCSNNRGVVPTCEEVNGVGGVFCHSQRSLVVVGNNEPRGVE